MTLLLSYLIFTKPLTEQHGTGLLLIAMGITLKLLPGDDMPNKRASTAPSPDIEIGKSSSREERARPDNDGIEGEEEERKPLV